MSSIEDKAEAAVAAHKLDEEVVVAAATDCTQGEASAASAANGLAAKRQQHKKKKEKMSTERAHETREAVIATMTTKIEGDMLRSPSNMKDQIEERDDEVKALIEERRNIKKEDKEQIKKNVSKKIQKCIREQKKIKEARKNPANIGRVQKIKNTSSIKTAKKSTLIPKMKSGKGEVITSRRRIANVCGEFYSKLYAEDQCDKVEHDFDKSETRTSKGGKSDEEGKMKEIPEFTKKEVQIAVDILKKGKAGDSNGIRKI